MGKGNKANISDKEIDRDITNLELEPLDMVPDWGLDDDIPFYDKETNDRIRKRREQSK